MTHPPHLHVLDSGPGSAAWNMALDEALLQNAATSNAALLRFYSWTEPAASFGYSQNHAAIAAQTSLRPLVRRCTGGGLVPHDRDWTYSLAVPPGAPWYELSASDSYRRIHEWVSRAFARLGLATELAPCCRKERPGLCFVGHEKFDLLWQGRKIAGAAQRRNRRGLLIQGSVQPPPPVQDHRSQWIGAMGESAPPEFFCAVVPGTLSSEVLASAQELARDKYERVSYTETR